MQKQVEQAISKATSEAGENLQQDITNQILKALEDFKNINIIPLPCHRPTFRNQMVITESGIYKLDNENFIFYSTGILPDNDLKSYLKETMNVERKSGRSGFGIKPRKEVCYSPDGKPYVYSNISHPTKKYPNHVTRILKYFLDFATKSCSDEGLPKNPYIKLSSGVDIIYDNSFPLGGSISAHKDDEEDWGMVIVFSLGQTRYLRVRGDDDGSWYNVEMVHNSVTVMYGPSFQKNYTHQVDKLNPNDKVGARLSLNMRYKK